MQFTLVFSQEPEWGYTVEVAELPWCVSYWETLDEAKTMIQEAIEGYLESMKEHNETFVSRPTFISSFMLNDKLPTPADTKIFA